MSLEGKIETVSLSGIFQLLCNESKTGILRVKNETTEYQIYFLDGNILYAGVFHTKPQNFPRPHLNLCQLGVWMEKSISELDNIEFITS